MTLLPGDVRIYGNVEGKVTSDRCELKQQARVVGDMKTRSLAMEEGAHLLGRTEIG
ncbi:MAG: polymer-forming cytoskeletal protein [Akkermansia sp.]